MIIDDPVRDSAVDRRDTAVARIGQLEVFDPFSDRSLSIRARDDSGHAPCQAGRLAQAEISGIGLRHDLVPDALQQIDRIFILEPEGRRYRYVDSTDRSIKRRKLRRGRSAD